ncbi:LOW QUALITY PROTEIN: hypothetical protein PanWU01x14_071870 [Parasponia andersonii]|uniref:Uncharacterized protein n=1 Tax=Parasponia andersonii TaxID=3476 RepID=A0A2P5DEN0_PARAD|nr:LOW QUALITY PROTEIN: hypothetical protein PanWU01x14_071870 [Parasponia andersonii]
MIIHNSSSKYTHLITHSEITFKQSLNSLRLLRLRRWQLPDGDGQNSILADSGDGIRVGILWQHKLPHELADPPLHSHVLGSFFLLLPLPLAAYQKHIVFLHLHFDVLGFEPRHVDDEHVRVRVLLHVRRGRRHGLGVPDVSPGGRIEGPVVGGVVGGVDHVVES